MNREDGCDRLVSGGHRAPALRVNERLTLRDRVHESGGRLRSPRFRRASGARPLAMVELADPLWRKLEEIEPAQSHHDQRRADHLRELTEPDVCRDLRTLLGTFGWEHTVAGSMAGGVEVGMLLTSHRPVLLDLKVKPHESDQEPEDADPEPSHDAVSKVGGKRGRGARAADRENVCAMEAHRVPQTHACDT